MGNGNDSNDTRHRFKPGDIVNIFSDPPYFTKLEGQARLIRYRWSDLQMGQYWDVEFLVDGERVSRWVNSRRNTRR